MNLVELLRMPEGKGLEFKRDLSGKPGIVRTLVAFANSAGGGARGCDKRRCTC